MVQHDGFGSAQVGRYSPVGARAISLSKAATNAEGFTAPRQGEFVIDNKERHALHSHPARLFFCRANRFDSFVAFQQLLSSVPVQSGFGDHVEEHLLIADVPPFGEICRNSASTTASCTPSLSASQMRR